MQLGQAHYAAALCSLSNAYGGQHWALASRPCSLGEGMQTSLAEARQAEKKMHAFSNLILC